MANTITCEMFEELVKDMLDTAVSEITFTPWKEQQKGKGWDVSIVLVEDTFKTVYFFTEDPIRTFYADIDDDLAQRNPTSDDIHYFVPWVTFA